MFDFCFIYIPIQNFFINFEILCHIQCGSGFLKKDARFSYLKMITDLVIVIKQTNSTFKLLRTFYEPCMYELFP